MTRARLLPLLSLLPLLGCPPAGDDARDTSTPDTDSDADTDTDSDTDTQPDADVDDDGVRVDADCDDTDAALGARAEDADCDGVRTDADCDDADPTLPADADDPDCDGTPTHLGGGDMVRIAASSFEVGCTAGQSECRNHEEPAMPVTLTHDYYLSVTEVTQGQYQAVMGVNPSDEPDCGPDCPVESVSWHMVADFANALSAAAGLSQCYACVGAGSSVACTIAADPYACDGYRLPTEAEWEGAARCGTDLLYAGSDTADEVGWYDDNRAGGRSRAVAGKSPNACGLYDMSGNVSEWTQDWYGAIYYTPSGRTDPVGPETGSSRVLRGGSWSNSARYLRVSDRVYADPAGLYDTIGIRLARTIP